MSKSDNLKQTKEYRLFQHDPTNRSVRKTAKIKASMKQWGFLKAYPLACVPNGAKMTIRDGAHRFEIAMELKLPVWYVCDKQMADMSIPEVNGATAGAWTPPDYIESFCNQGKVEYAKLRTFVQDTHIPPLTAASLLYGHNPGGSITDIFRGGTFKVRNLEHANQVAQVLSAVSKFAKWSKNKYLVDATSRIVRVCNPAELAEKITKQPGLLMLQPNSDAFLGMLEAVYNYRSRSPEPLKFLAVEFSKNRNPAKAAK